MGVKILKKVCVSAALAAAAFALACNGGGSNVAEEAPKPQFDPNDARHQASYSIGRSYGKEVKGLGEYADIDIVLLAFKEALEGVPAQISDSALTVIDTRVLRERRELEMQKRKKLEEANLAATTAFLEQNKANEGVIVTESGLQYIVLNEGRGPKPTTNDKVKIHYHGTLPDGTIFDSSRNHSEAPIFAVTGVMRGWTEALLLMSPGSKLKIFLPPDLAYGRRGTARIAPNTALIFELELLEIVKERS